MTTIIDLTKTATYRTMAEEAIEKHRNTLIHMGYDPDDEEQFDLLAWMVKDWEEG
jgi:hypothetical protein